MKYALFDEHSKLQTCLIEGVHQIPASAVKIDQDLFVRLTQETDGIWRKVGNEIIKEPFPQVAPDYARSVAAERYEREDSAVSVDGLSIATSRESAGLIYGAGLSAMLDPDYRCNFKTLDGFVEIGAQQILAIAKAVRAHVQACFDREFQLLQAVEAGTYVDAMLKEGWPDSVPVTPISALQ
ncbi:DUF4376 domain-containing protein [Pseudomonas sp. MYb2]|jgi:hypothetical protein|uniref:DUF4376 domain-containing protein n=1 Tax=Pseudomonas TaxID=286 RepID=UPI0006D6C950|nr:MULTISPECIES: DUF4376 domain-containing protein [Pseudomonas]KPG90497.1 hypothetical protein AK821_28125 [Pseudomonas sp. RIT-PI-r]MCP1484012.1 hypothetical protein [Pseudomonas fluorescens]PRB55342.1 DUF4376 domain-containing protein [Pseudomonas sp. MYb3]PRC33251.1 DUF4376 domain-containing protein [Pseudomonas sp. MYb2]